MKELTIEEKAKAYDEAIERARAKYVMQDQPTHQDLVDIFPELKESEDEKIRKALIKLVKKAGEGYENVIDGVSIENAIAWLEKQGEQKPAKNIVETWKEMRLEVYSQASGNRHEPNCSDDSSKIFSLNDIDEIFEKISNCVVEQKPVEWGEADLICLGYLAVFVDKNGDDFYGKNKPNVVKWIRSFAELPTHIPINEIEQKPAEWSEEDEQMFKTIANSLDRGLIERVWHTTIEKVLDWLKSLKDRVQPKQEWSEEDNRMYNRIVSFIPQHLTAESYTACITWLKSLKDRYNWKPSEEELTAILVARNNVDCKNADILKRLYNDLEKL